MKVILDAIDQVKGQVLSATEIDKIKAFLDENFPEADWDVRKEWGGYGTIQVTPIFRSKEDETFYRIKWS
jgi:hypothetical protein